MSAKYTHPFELHSKSAGLLRPWSIVITLAKNTMHQISPPVESTFGFVQLDQMQKWHDIKCPVGLSNLLSHLEYVFLLFPYRWCLRLPCSYLKRSKFSGDILRLQMENYANKCNTLHYRFSI